MASPSNESGACPATGTSKAASAAVARPTTGPALKTHEVVVLKTEPFCQSLIRS